MHDQDDYWTHHTRLFDGALPYFDRTGKRKTPVWGRIHVAEEKYFDATELVPFSERNGTRVYVMMHPYVLQPKLTMTVGLYKTPKRLADTDPVIGKTLGTRQDRIQEVQVGNAQAWYYPADRILVLWECFLDSRFRDKALLQDPNMRSLGRL